MVFDMKKSLLILALLFIAVTSAPESFAQNAGYSAYCVAVIDGDTIKVKTKGTEQKIRLYGIDCPELDQPFGSQAKNKTKKLIQNKRVKIQVLDKDRYGRLVALVSTKTFILQEELLKSGLAVVYPMFCKMPICSKWQQLEEQAKEQKKGIWKSKHTAFPWEWRKK